MIKFLIVLAVLFIIKIAAHHLEPLALNLIENESGYWYIVGSLSMAASILTWQKLNK